MSKQDERDKKHRDFAVGFLGICIFLILFLVARFAWIGAAKEMGL